MNAIELFTGPFAQALGWALLHLLWQASIVAAILAAALALLPRQSASARYAASCGALALVFALFVTTAIRTFDPHAAPIAVTAAVPAGEMMAVPLTKLPAVIVATAAESWRDRAVSALATARQSLPSIVALWLMGVVFLSSRLMVSWIRARALVREADAEADAEWQRVASRLSQALGLRQAVRLLRSASVEVPSVLGTLRPVILLPVSTLTGLTPEQLEMVLAHELAHIRRYDTLVNLAQTVVETLLFFHPAAWWLSARVRDERESCCDEIAIAACGVTRREYGTMLLHLEESRAAVTLAAAANDGSLLRRIRRIAGIAAPATELDSTWIAGFVTMLLALAVVMPPAVAEPAPVALPASSTPAVSVSGRWVAVADYSTDAVPFGLGDTMSVIQTDRLIGITTDSGGRSIERTFRVDDVRAKSIDATGPFPQAETTRYSWATFSLDESNMLIVQALARPTTGEMPLSVFRRFRRPDAVLPRISQGAPTRRLALVMAIEISHGLARAYGSKEDFDKEPPFTGIVLIDGQRATLDRMRALDRRDVRRYSWLVGSVAPRYFADPQANTGVIAFETGQLRKP